MCVQDVGGESEMHAYRDAGDAFFSLWLNKPPVELANDIVPYKRQIDEPKVYNPPHLTAQILLESIKLHALLGYKDRTCSRASRDNPRSNRTSHNPT
jgi:hypothetical protein